MFYDVKKKLSGHIGKEVCAGSGRVAPVYSLTGILWQKPDKEDRTCADPAKVDETNAKLMKRLFHFLKLLL